MPADFHDRLLEEGEKLYGVDVPYVNPVRFPTPDERQDAAERIMRKHSDECLGLREEMLEKLLTYALAGVLNLRLVEDRSDPLKTEWRFETDDR